MNNEYGTNIESASYIGNPFDNTVMYLTKKVEYLVSNLRSCKNCLVFCDESVQIDEDINEKHTIIKSNNPIFEYAQYVTELANRVENERLKKKYTLTNQGYYIGEDVIVGDNAYIEPLCFIDHNVIIGNNARILSGAKIRNAIIGDNFIAGENSVIGSYAFTMARDESDKLVRIPSLGKLHIGNNVEIGTQCNISVGTAGNTHINDYVKIDALTYIGHDTILQNNVEVCSGAIIGGYNTVKDNVIIGLNATIRNRLIIDDNSRVGMGSVVTKLVSPNTTVIGNPAKILENNP